MLIKCSFQPDILPTVRVCLGEPVARSGKLPTLAPPLLRQLAAIGNNLNQTARKVNSG
ncbi:plasmid mobilization relaxosome protein MobC, partial [Escherichia coli]|uniref:plasmid mobilization relaxosome protein MobC n=1 Tax=Escherichia coli TaxID=562 RepID=UPI003EE3DF74